MAKHSGSMAWVQLRLPDGGTVRAEHGAIVGRLATCAVQLDDPGVSEAHALVTLRAGAFRMLGLRGQLATAGDVVREALLVPGVEVQVTPRLALLVMRVQVPRAVMAIEAPGMVRQALPSSAAITTAPRPTVSPSFSEHAGAWVWFNGIEWRLRIGTQAPQPLHADASFVVDDVTFTTSLLPLAAAGGAVTQASAMTPEPLTIDARYDVVRIARVGFAVTTIVGRPARIISELAAIGGAAPWEVLATEIWPDRDRLTLRKKLDMSLKRLRDKLRAARIRPDLVRPHGNGTFELVLHARDRVEVAT